MRLTVRSDSPLLEYLYEALAPQSRTKTKSLLTSGQICVNGQMITAFDHIVKAGDKIEILPKGSSARYKVSEDKRVHVIYEDRWLIVIDKAAGLPTISTGKEGAVTAYSLVTDYMRQKEGGRVFIVHRLDRDTSGILIFAKDPETKEMLQDRWDEAVEERLYTGVAEGLFGQQEGRITSWLKEHPKSLKMSSSPTDNGGSKAITCYKVLDSRSGYSLVELSLLTGRKNQIRVQLSSIGHPLAGDRKYDAKTNPFGRLALHASGLTFIHPHTGERLNFRSRAPFGL